MTEVTHLQQEKYSNFVLKKQPSVEIFLCGEGPGSIHIRQRNTHYTAFLLNDDHERYSGIYLFDKLPTSLEKLIEKMVAIAEAEKQFRKIISDMSACRLMEV